MIGQERGNAVYEFFDKLPLDEPEQREVECRQCNGTGEDRRTGTDCMNCWGFGTLLED